MNKCQVPFLAKSAAKLCNIWMQSLFLPSPLDTLLWIKHQQQQQQYYYHTNY